MVSLAEKMAANLDMSVLGKAEELKKRLWFTIMALIVFRLGTFIPLPGIDPKILADIFDRNSGGILGMFNMFEFWRTSLIGTPAVFWVCLICLPVVLWSV